MAEGHNVLLGILAIILGILVIAFPLFSVFAASVLAGFAIIFLGIWLLVQSFGTWTASKGASIAYFFEIARDLATAKAAEEKEYRIRKVIDDKEISTLYQPIWRLENPRPLGFECLSRFSAAPTHSPQGWFAEAAEVGLGASLELAAAERGLAVLDRLPPDIYLAGICHRRPSSAAIFPR